MEENGNVSGWSGIYSGFTQRVWEQGTDVFLMTNYLDIQDTESNLCAIVFTNYIATKGTGNFWEDSSMPGVGVTND